MSTKLFPINHDLHCHTFFSKCCEDPAMTADYILDFAAAHGYDTVAITDHFWDPAVPGASGWHSSQDYDNICKSLPLPANNSVNMLFGCETEYCGGKKLGIAPQTYDKFDIIIVPVNHFHMDGFVRPLDCDTPEKLAELLTSRMEEICQIPLPWTKIGIAHLNGCIFMEGEGYNRAMMLAPEDRLREVFRFFGKNGAGIELNTACFPHGWRDDEEASLRLFRIALEENCKFFCASDAHTQSDLLTINERMREVADVLGLTAENLFMPA